MKLARIFLMALTGYFVGFVLGRCAIENASAQLPKNEQVHLNSKNTVVLRGEVSPTSIITIQLALADLVETRSVATYPIYLVLDSPGGDVDSGLQFIEFAKTIPNLRTITIFAASMAAGIVEGLPGSRLIAGNGTLMFHRAAGQLSGQFEVGEMETRLAMAKEMVRNMEQNNAERLGITLEDYKVKIKDEYWLLSKRAVSEKAADKIIDIVCSQELINTREEISMESIFGTAHLEFSGCPTFRYPVISKKNVVALLGF